MIAVSVVRSTTLTFSIQPAMSISNFSFDLDLDFNFFQCQDRPVIKRSIATTLHGKSYNTVQSPSEISGRLSRISTWDVGYQSAIRRSIWDTRIPDRGSSRMWKAIRNAHQELDIPLGYPSGICKPIWDMNVHLRYGRPFGIAMIQMDVHQGCGCPSIHLGNPSEMWISMMDIPEGYPHPRGVSTLLLLILL